jgi:RHS repeat-associated protein
MNLVLRSLLALFLFPLASSGAHAAVDPTSGEYTTERTDIWVKVPGGKLPWSRSYEKNAWSFNPAWARLKIEIDALEGTVSRIQLGRNAFEKVDAAGTLFRFDQRQTIQKTDAGWRWQNRDGYWFEYSELGLPERFGDRSDNVIRLEHDGEGRLIEVWDATDRKVFTVTWTGTTLTEVRDYTDRKVTYRYSGGLLTEVIDLRGKSWKYAYSSGRLVKLTDPLNNETPLTLTKSGRAGVVTGPDGAVTQTTFDYLSGPKLYYLKTVRTNGELQEVVETWTDRERELVRRDVNGVTVLKVTRDGRKRVHTDYRGRQTVYDHDEFKNVVKVTYPDGRFTERKYDPATSNLLEETDTAGVTTEHRYDPQGLRTRTIEARGTPVQRITDYEYEEGRLKRLIRRGDAVTAEAVTEYDFDAVGNVRRIIDPELGETTFEDFDAMGNARVRIDARGKRWISTLDHAGNLISQTDPLNHTTRFEHDDAGRRVKTIHPEVDGITATTEYRFDPAGRLTHTIDHLGGTRRTEYDRVGNRVEEVDEAGKLTRYRYDAYNRLSQIIDGNDNVTRFVYPDPANPGPDAGDLYQPVRIEYPTFVREMKYDLRDRVWEQTEVFADVEGTQRTTTTTRFNDAGQPKETIDAARRSTHHEYDALGRLTQTTDALQGKTRYGYDNRDNLLSLTDANDNTHRFTFDRANRTKSESRPMGQTHRYDYDPAGNLIKKTDARGQVAEYGHDDAGRRDTIRYFRANETVPHKTVRFTYNARNTLAGYDDGITSAQYIHDALQRKTSEAVDYGDFVWTYHYSYYPNGQKASYTAIDGTEFSYAYDAAKNLASIVIPNEGAIEYGSYRWTRPQTVTYPGGTIRSLSYDGLLRSEMIRVVNAQNDVLMDYRYRYDAAGNIVEKNTEHGPYLYGYDELDRLTAADYPNGPNNDQINDSMAPNTFPFADDLYTYDQFGNRLTDKRQTQDFRWQYNANNELLHSGSAGYEYNENGSTIAKKNPQTYQPIQRYGYNSEERMDELRVENGTLVADYYYDPFGRRLWKTLYPGAEGHPGGDGAVRSYMAYCDEGYAAESLPMPRGIAPRVPDLQVVLFEVGMPWSTSPVLRVGAGQSIFLYTNHVGTPMRSVEFSIRRAAFGASAGTRNTRFGFPGQYSDSESGLFYNFHRYYRAELGSYGEVDLLPPNVSRYRYAYAAQNPLKNIDPLGLLESCRFGFGVGCTPPKPEPQDYRPCSYYKDVSDNFGCRYHAQAYEICKGNHTGVNIMTAICNLSGSAALNCIRRCLANADSNARTQPDCLTTPGDASCGDLVCTKRVCVHKYHVECYEICGISRFCFGGIYWGGYASDG